MKKIVIALLLGLFGSNNAMLQALQDSIIPTMEWYECSKHLCVKKYSHIQYRELQEALSHHKERIRVVSYNILFDLYDDQREESYRWKQRLPRLAVSIENMDPDILGVQELCNNQVQDLVALLEDKWAFYGESSYWGECNGIFYKKNRFDLIECQALPTQDREDMISNTVMMVHLKDYQTGQKFVVFNTHFSFEDVEERALQAQFIADYIEPISTSIPVILMGDLNTFPHRLDLRRLPFYDGDYIHRILSGRGLKEAKEVSLLGHLGPISTFTNKGDDPTPFLGTGVPGIFLDHLYVSKGITVLLHAVEPALVNGLYPSDHMPVIMDCIIE